AAAGILLAAWTSQILVSQLSTRANPVFLDLSIDGRVLAFTLAITVIVTLAFGTAPAFRTARVAPIDALKQHGRPGRGVARGTLAGWLIVPPVALWPLLVVAAGVFVRPFVSLANRPLGFDPSRVLVVIVDAHRTT